jgi:signal transduction histidine kinase
MNAHVRTFSIAWHLFSVFSSAAALMFTVEILKVFVFASSLSLWQSHAITITAAAIGVTVISYFIRKIVHATDMAMLTSEEQTMRSEAKSILSTLTAGVSHELNSPLGNSIIAATTLADRVGDFRQAMTTGTLKRTDLDTTCTNIEAGAAIIERNLARAQALLTCFRQVSTNQASEQRRQFDLAETIRDVLFMLGPSLSRQSHRVVLEIPSGIIMDSQPGSLEQIIINLVNNAYLHAFELRRDGLLNIKADAKDGRVTLTVTDNGIGMDEGTASKMFQPYFSTKIGQGGTGLGMAIVENLVKRLGGEITVYSKRGEGTCFTLTLLQNLPDEVESSEAADMRESDANFNM